MDEDLDNHSIGSTDTSDEESEFVEALVVDYIFQYDAMFLNKAPLRVSSLRGSQYINEMLAGPSQVCYEMLRMNKATFILFCDLLKTDGYLKDSKKLRVEEQVAMFLIVVRKHWDQRSVCDRFQHSLETVNRHVKYVLKAVARLAKHMIRQSCDDDLPPHIKRNKKYYPWFKDCVGAIDGTHISAWAPSDKIVSCRGRKSIVTQNVLCACNFNMEFTFVYSGWEGTANDSRVFLDALIRPENKFPWPNPGKYYLVDSGFPCNSGFLPPYRGERYHLQDYRGRGRNIPQGPRELFNYRHSSLRNVIERCFGVLKARFPILKMMPRYKPVKQRLMVVACCVIHNFIRKHSQTDEMFREFDVEELLVDDEGSSSIGTNHFANLADERAAEMAAQRAAISELMWNERYN